MTEEAGTGRAVLISEAPREDLGRLLVHAQASVPYYRERLRPFAGELAGYAPEDLWRLPATPREDLRADWRRFRSETVDTVWISWSGGTMGKPKVIFHTREDIDWAHVRNTDSLRMAGVRSSDVVAVALPFGMWFVGWDYVLSSCRLGATVAPVGLGFGARAMLETVVELDGTVLVSTPGAIRDVADYIANNPRAPVPPLRLVIVLGELIGPAFRTLVRERLGAEVYSFLGAAEFDGMAIECPYHDGFHALPGAFWFEILPLSSGTVSSDLPVGELLVTPRLKLGTPLIRYLQGDIAKVAPPCPCGWPGPKFNLVGRSDDAAVLGDGTKVYIYQVEQALAGLSDFVSFFRLVLDRKGNTDELTLEIESPRFRDTAFLSQVQERLAHLSVDFEDSLRLGAVARPRVRAVRHLGEERTPRGKSRRIIDNRRR